MEVEGLLESDDTDEAGMESNMDGVFVLATGVVSGMTVPFPVARGVFVAVFVFTTIRLVIISFSIISWGVSSDIIGTVGPLGSMGNRGSIDEFAKLTELG